MKKITNINFVGDKLKECLVKNNLHQTDFAKHLGVTHSTINEIIHGRRGVTVEMAAKLNKAFPNISIEEWLSYQIKNEIAELTLNDEKMGNISKIEKVKRNTSTNSLKEVLNLVK